MRASTAFAGDASFVFSRLVRATERFRVGLGALLFVGASPPAGSDLGSSLGGLAGLEDEKRRWRGFGRAELSCAV